MIDKFFKKLTEGKSKGKEELAVKIMILMKCAAVVGDVFGSDMVHKIIPLKGESHTTILSLIQFMEANDFIEVLD